MRHEPRQDVDGSFAKARPFTTEPLLEGLLTDVDTVQQISDIECSGLFEVIQSVSRGQTLKLGDIDLDGRPIETHPIALDHQDWRMKGGEGTSESTQTLTEALSRLLLPCTAPEHRGQFVSCVALFRSYGKVSEQSLGLPRLKRQASLTQMGLKPS